MPTVSHILTFWHPLSTIINTPPPPPPPEHHYNLYCTTNINTTYNCQHFQHEIETSASEGLGGTEGLLAQHILHLKGGKTENRVGIGQLLKLICTIRNEGGIAVICPPHTVRNQGGIALMSRTWRQEALVVCIIVLEGVKDFLRMMGAPKHVHHQFYLSFGQLATVVGIEYSKHEVIELQLPATDYKNIRSFYITHNERLGGSSPAIVPQCNHIFNEVNRIVVIFVHQLEYHLSQRITAYFVNDDEF